MDCDALKPARCELRRRRPAVLHTAVVAVSARHCRLALRTKKRSHDYHRRSSYNPTKRCERLLPATSVQASIPFVHLAAAAVLVHQRFQGQRVVSGTCMYGVEGEVTVCSQCEVMDGRANGNGCVKGEHCKLFKWNASVRKAHLNGWTVCGQFGTLQYHTDQYSHALKLRG